MLYIARRLYSDGGSASGSRISMSAVRIATAGVAIGVLVMIMSVAIAVGFQREIRQRVADLGGHVQVMNPASLYKAQSQPVDLNDTLCAELKKLPGVLDLQRFASVSGMLKTENAFQGIVLRGVGKDCDRGFLEGSLKDGVVPRFGFTKEANDSILLSKPTADALGLKTGQQVYAYFFNGGLKARHLTVSGIYQTHMSDFDRNLCFADVRLTQQLLGWQGDQFSGAEIRVDNFDDVAQVNIDVLRKVIHLTDKYGNYYSASSVFDMYPQIFSWLTLLDTNVIAILILMICVASVTMVSGLLIIILERTRFIGVMKAMGATNGQLRRLFLWLASMIVVRGMVVGDVLALVLLTVQKYTGIIRLDPENYYLEHVPVYFHWSGFALINVVTLIACVLVLVIPSYVVSRIHPAKSIRFE